MLMTLAAKRCEAMFGKYPCSIPMYAASTPPATVAKPPTMIVLISERVIVLMNGLMRSGASVCPMKMLPEAERVSAPDVPSVFCTAQAMPFTIHCITLR